jgi:tRNA threonylcarbamoyladenosine biosynthesis protein TsaE
MAVRLQCELVDLSATFEFGRRVGSLLVANSVVGLSGCLGAGKTHLVRAIAEGVGIADSRAVSSPTFVLIQEYRARLPIYHFDVYRLRAPAEFAELGVDEYFGAGGVCLVEWADRVTAQLPTERLDVHLEVTGETSRLVMIEGRGQSYEGLVRALC